MKHNKNKVKLFKVYGLNGCSTILSADSCQIDRIILSEDFQSSKIENCDSLFANHKDRIYRLSRHEFKSNYDSHRSQGIIIYFNYEIYSDLPELKINQNNACYLLLDSIKDPQNLGQILRTCECAGVGGVVIPERRSVPITDTVLQVSQGAFCNLNIVISKNIKYAINHLKEDGYWVIGIENSIQSKNWYDINMNGKMAFVFGSEGEGIRPLIKKYCDDLGTIPMLGEINSLNISATVSAIVFERNRQILKGK